MSSQKVKNWILTSISTLFIGIISTVINSKIQKIDFFESLFMILNRMYAFFLSIIYFRIPVWIILSVLVGLFILLYLHDKISPDPPKKKRTTLEYKRWLFKWEYSGNNIINLRPICECGCELSLKNQYQYNRSILMCPRCDKQYSTIQDETLKDAEKVIIHHLNNVSMYEVDEEIN